MPNVALDNHPMIGQTLTYGPMREPYNPANDTEPGHLIVGNGMTVEVLSVFHDWNNVPGLTVFYVYVPATRERTHLSAKECGYVYA